MENEKYVFKLEENEYRGEITEEMVTYVRQLVRSKVRKRPVPGCETEDLEQYALENTVKYIHRHDSKKAPLAGYLNIIVSSALRDANRYATKPHRYSNDCENFSYEVAFNQKENSSTVQESALAYMDRNYNKIGFKVDLFHYSELSELEKKIVQLMYVEKPKTEIARRLGISLKKLQTHIDLIGAKYLLGRFFYRYRSENSEQ